MNPAILAAWRLIPRAPRRAAMTRLAALLARKPDAAPPERSNGIVLAGDGASANGLAESARILHQVIGQHGLARGFVPLGLPGFVEPSNTQVPRDAALLAVVNAPFLPIGLLRLQRDFIAGRRVIGFWAWELPEVPRPWSEGAKFVHEIWAPSRFTATALEKLKPGRVRAVPFPMAEIPLPASGTRAEFGLPEDVCIVLTVFNLASSMVRKNPLGCIAAFRRAFGESRDYLFVMKLSGVAHYMEDLRVILAAIGEAPNMRLITETLPEDKLRGLIAASDIVLCLHRSEGFGLIPATALLMGKAVVATGWSGNLDFMSPQSSALVSYRLIQAADPRGTYDVPDALWAEPEVEDAAARLRELAGDPRARGALAAAGQAYARQALGAAPLLAALKASGVT
jgi:hypothetical protein